MPHSFANGGELLRAVPVTLVFLVLSVLGFLLVYLAGNIEWIAAFTFTDFELRGGRVQFLPGEGEYWRWLTPIFLHFHWLHIAFNGLWLWEIGALIEQRLGSALLCVLILLSGTSSNWAQFWWSGPSLFGGMSGVVYALLGFCWVYGTLLPESRMALPRGIVVLMLVWLVLGMVGAVEAVGLGAIANAAHFAGLVSGVALGAIVAGSHRLGRAV